jgi:ubiquinone/menaquinone biosynthesis C-methylase UbiE
MERLADILKTPEETIRLDRKTDLNAIKKQALWAGIQPGMRVADLGFGSGKTTYCLNSLVSPSYDKTIGIDNVEERVLYAKTHHNNEDIEYIHGDIREPLDGLGLFDFIFIRFVLEYNRKESFHIVKNVSKILKSGGILCLIDLDYNCLSHFELPKNLETAVYGIMNTLEEKADFDPYVGRKLYSYLYDLKFEDINVDLAHHQLIYGALGEIDDFNWMKKIELAGRNSGYDFSEYKGGFNEFSDEFKKFFSDHRRFTYNIVISCRGCKPV